jgi:hypothetical protein
MHHHDDAENLLVLVEPIPFLSLRLSEQIVVYIWVRFSPSAAWRCTLNRRLLRLPDLLVCLPFISSLKTLSTLSISRRSTMTKKIRVVKTKGNPFERGFQHGKECRQDIIRYTEERMRLARQAKWSGHDLTREEVLKIASQCIPDH